MNAKQLDFTSSGKPSRLLLISLLAMLCSMSRATAQTEEATSSPEAAAPNASNAPSESSETKATSPAPESTGSAPTEPTAESSAEATAPTPAPEPRALEESGLSNPGGRDAYKRPLLFAPEDNGLGLVSPQLRWELVDGRRIDLSGIKIESSAIRFHLDQIKRDDASWRFRDSDRKGTWVTNVSFEWPVMLTRVGKISFETKDGKVVWSQAITDQNITDWKEKIGKPPSPQVKEHAGSQWGIFDIEPKKFAFLAKVATRFCVEDKHSETEILKICSGLFGVKAAKGGTLNLISVKDPVSANVWIGEKEVGPRGYVNFPPKDRVRLRVKFTDGGSIDISSQPAQLKLLDVVLSKSGRSILLTGAGTEPLGRVKVISRPETHFWSKTGFKEESVWQIAIPKDRPTVRVLGAFNLPFTMIFEFDSLPKESDRVYIADRQDGTYSSSPRLYGYSGAGDKISSTEKKAKNTGAQNFEWDFGAPVQGQDNRSRLKVKEKDGKTWIAHHSLYRGHPFEASARLTGVVTAQAQMVLLGELAGSAWFENLGISDNEWLALQRWGITTRYFRALSSIDLGDEQSISEFTVLNADLKYNLVRGLWNRDELFGLVMSGQRVNLSGITANLGGVGAYWARTMPKLFDDIFNILPFMEYPKYVDVEFIYYPMSLSSEVSAGVSYNLNFHGKVFWSRGFFGEAGFGLKRFEYTDEATASVVSFSTAYGTVGVGLQF